ncbi:hypothetical protein HGM15179_005279 [Zosterops borbonicus]|uniref:Uncharacterized protein n=1 Tax=Zosterops borbonicus TaxID=364589 RepID=A0A8K1GMM2_9PASS|nr:hypothetical protein HGM15179_005279 [Zosterops borbonicus]
MSRKGMELRKALGDQVCGKCMREPGLFSLEKRRLRGNLIVIYNYLNGGCSQVVLGISFQKASGRTRGTGFKENQGIFRFDITKNFFRRKGYQAPEQTVHAGGKITTPGREYL